MRRQAVETLLDKWTTDPTFRVAMRQNSEAAVKALDVELDQDEWSALRAVTGPCPTRNCERV
jgi:hypothetical protein